MARTGENRQERISRLRRLVEARAEHRGHYLPHEEARWANLGRAFRGESPLSRRQVADFYAQLGKTREAA